MKGRHFRSSSAPCVAACAHGARPVRPGRDADPVQDPDLRARRGSAVADRPGGPARRLPDDGRGRGGPAGRARPRRGRRPGRFAGRTPVDAGRPRPGLRFVGIELGATSMRVAVTDGRLEVLARDNHALDIRRGPEAVLAEALEMTRKLLAERGRRTAGRPRHRRPGPGRLPGGRPGVAADHAWLGRLPGPRRPLPRARHAGAARQRRQRDGARRAAHRRRAVGLGLPLRQDRHRHRLRHRGRRPPLPRRRRLRRRHRAHPARRRTARSARAATTAVSRPSSAVPRWPATPRQRRGRAARPCWPSCSRRTARSPPSSVGLALGRGRRGRAAAHPRRRPPGRLGAGQPGVVLQPRTDRDRRRRGRPRSRPARRDPQRRSTASRCRWPPGTCRSCSASSVATPASSARPG